MQAQFSNADPHRLVHRHSPSPAPAGTGSPRKLPPILKPSAEGFSIPERRR